MSSVFPFQKFLPKSYPIVERPCLGLFSSILVSGFRRFSFCVFIFVRYGFEMPVASCFGRLIGHPIVLMVSLIISLVCSMKSGRRYPPFVLGKVSVFVL